MFVFTYWLGALILSVVLIRIIISINNKLDKVLLKIESLELKWVEHVNHTTQLPLNIKVDEQDQASLPISDRESYFSNSRQTVLEAPAPTTNDRTTNQLKPQPVRDSDVFDKLGSWLKEDWAMKLGAFFLLLAFIWLAEYAIEENWISETGRINLGILTGFVVMIFGWFDIKKHFNQGSIFFVLGSLISIATISVSRVVYPDMINPTVASILMFAFSAFVSIVAISYNNKALAMVSVFGMGIVPLLLNSNGSLQMLFTYLVAVMLGAISVSWLMNYKSVIVVAEAFVIAYSLPALMNSSERGELLPLIYIFISVFFVSHILGFLRGKTIDASPDLGVGVLNSILLVMWALITVPKDWRGLTLTIWASIFALGAYTLSKKIAKSEPYYMYAAIAIALLGIATAAQFDGPMLAIAFAVEIGAVVFGSYKIHKDLLYSSKLSIIFILPFVIGIQATYSNLWNSGTLHTPFFTLLFLFLIPVLLGTYFYIEKAEGSILKPEHVDTWRFHTISLLVIGSLYGFAFVWKMFHAIIGVEYMAVLWSLVIYTIVGLTGYFSGLKNKARVLVVISTIVLGAVAARLLLVDVWQMEVAGRFITFLTIGLLFIMSAFYTRKLSKAEPLIHT